MCIFVAVVGVSRGRLNSLMRLTIANHFVRTINFYATTKLVKEFKEIEELYTYLIVLYKSG